MRDPPRREHDVTGTGGEFLLTDLEDVLTREDVEQLVLAFVDVQGRVDERRHLLEERERSSRRLGRRFHENRDAAELEAFPLVDAEHEGGSSVGHG